MFRKSNPFTRDDDDEATGGKNEAKLGLGGWSWSAKCHRRNTWREIGSLSSFKFRANSTCYFGHRTLERKSIKCKCNEVLSSVFLFCSLNRLAMIFCMLFVFCQTQFDILGSFIQFLMRLNVTSSPELVFTHHSLHFRSVPIEFKILILFLRKFWTLHRLFKTRHDKLGGLMEIDGGVTMWLKLTLKMSTRHQRERKDFSSIWVVVHNIQLIATSIVMNLSASTPHK